MAHDKNGQSDLVKRTVQRVAEVVPTTSTTELDNMIAAVPREYHHLIHEGMRHGYGLIEKAAAATLASIIVQQEEQANSAVTLWPINPATNAPYAGGATIPPNTVVALQPVTSGVTTGSYNFVSGQKFFGLLTTTVDTTAGWCFASNTVKLATDAISGLAYGDTSFGLFEQDVVQGRMITGEYERHTVIEEIQFFASAILRAGAAQPMLGGVTVQFWDIRCRNALNTRKWDLFDDDFSSLVREVVWSLHGGVFGRRLESLRLQRLGR